MLVLVARCDNLILGLKDGVGSKVYYEIINEVSSSNNVERRNPHIELIIKYTKSKLTVEE